ncbi:hypothetical protein [Nonomuraea roseoviolacea]|uniref:Uncharacterized protein n=1 Tax=Nonomuraea roseoviolacea subsp. carminata TaxID=160689 RepID=A0ABT1KFE8_9ACTN|nr:hypothetical protein [Nonomuraea roseoviolacea]MCP2352690.1 hypothetical protein [Nonomuraea roseoviolacea subsp. carminata]
MIAVERLWGMTAKEIVAAWRDGRLDPSIRIVSVVGELDDPRSLTYASPKASGWKS